MLEKENISIRTNKNDEKFVRIIDGNIGYLYSNTHDATTVAILWFDNKNEPEKELFLVKTSDYILNGQSYMDNKSKPLSKLEFKIEEDNMLHKPLQAFLAGKNSIVIDDDRY